MSTTPANKYQRLLPQWDAAGERDDVTIDVYDVLRAFGVTCPARQHAVKKILMAGQRGAKSADQDLAEAGEAIERAIELNTANETQPCPRPKRQRRRRK